MDGDELLSHRQDSGPAAPRPNAATSVPMGSNQLHGEIENMLCDSCQKIEFKKLVPMNRSWTKDESLHGRVIRLGESQPSSPGCILCATRLHYLSADDPVECVVAYIPQLDMTSETTIQEARSIHLRGLARVLLVNWNKGKLRSRDRPLMAGYYDKRYVDCFNSQAFSREFSPGLPLKWIEWCRNNHKCASRSDDVHLNHSIYLIDCGTRQVIKAEGKCKYVTLSYVWGDTKPPSVDWTPGSALPSAVPATIEDAIAVTQALGFSYLWVDRYCIDQHHVVPRQQQIDQMDAIYSCAEIAIVAAAGDGGNYGLPGLSRPSARLKVELNGVVLTSPHREVEAVAVASIWNSRGWTYQEILLSGRSLVFTEEHIFFACSAMSCWRAHEFLDSYSNQSDLRKEMTKCEERASFVDDIWSNYLYGEKGSGISVDSDVTDLYHMIMEYSARQLGRKEDILNAFVGILNRHKAIRNGRIDHIWGVPFRVSEPASQADSSDASSKYHTVLAPSFIQSLCWRHTFSENRSSSGLVPYDRADYNGHCVSSLISSSEAARVSKFPSWAWTGWIGRVIFPGFFRKSNDEYAARLMSFQDDDRVLELTAPFLPSESIQSSSTPCSDVNCMKLEILGLAGDICFPCRSESQETVRNKFESGQWSICLLYSARPFTCLLVLDRLPERSTYARVGSVTIYWQNISPHSVRKFVDGMRNRVERFFLR